MGRVWIEGALREELDLERDVMALYLMVANGLDGDVHFVGETPEVVAVVRGLLRGAGACAPIEAPADAPLYRPGDECFRQHPEARAFLAPHARNGEPPLPPVEPPTAPPAPTPSAAPAVAVAPPPDVTRPDPERELEALYARLRTASWAAGDLAAQLDRGFAEEDERLRAAIADHEREAAEAQAEIDRLLARKRRRSRPT